MMKTLILLFIAWLTSISASAEQLRCSLILVTPFEADPTEGNWIAPGAEIIAFDHETQSEKTLYIGVDQVYWPSFPYIQRTLKQVKNVDDAAFTLEFSKIDPYGKKLEGDSYGYFQILKGQSKPKARWTRAIGRTASLLDLPIRAGVTGQAIMTCLEK